MNHLDVKRSIVQLDKPIAIREDMKGIIHVPIGRNLPYPVYNGKERIGTKRYKK